MFDLFLYSLNIIINSRFNIISEIDPIYNLKSVKNNTEIKNTIKAHIEDGVAITKFLYWFKTNDAIITEKKVNEMWEKLLVNLIIEDYKINKL